MSALIAVLLLATALLVGSWTRRTLREPKRLPRSRSRSRASAGVRRPPSVVERRSLSIGGKPSTLEVRVDGLTLDVPLWSAVPLPVDEDERTEQAVARLKRGGARITYQRYRLVLDWSGPRELGDDVWDDAAQLLPLCTEAVLELSYEVNAAALQTLGVGIDQLVYGQELDLILWLPRTHSAVISRLGTASSLRNGRLHIVWNGTLGNRPETKLLFDRLGEALAQPVADPWVAFEEALTKNPRRALAFALRVTGPVLERTVHRLAHHSDATFAWQVVSRGAFDDWLIFALNTRHTLEDREAALHRIQGSPPSQRCRAAPLLFAESGLRLRACALLEGLEGHEAENAWLAMLKTTNDPDWLRHIVPSLGEVGGASALAALHELKSELGALQFQLRELVEQAQSDIRARAGAVAGALSLAEDSQGQLSLPSPQKEEPWAR